MTAAVSVTHNEAASRFEATVEGHVGELVYRRDGDRIFLLHTGVPGPIEGRGVGSALVETAVNHAIEGRMTIVPVCWFVRGWLRRHPEAADRASIESPEETI